MTAPVFGGAKAATFIGERLLVILRDDRSDIPYPAHWDFPGGGREPGESGLETLAREMHEEVRLDLARGNVVWSRLLPSLDAPGVNHWFYVVKFPESEADRVVLGDEGQRWEMITPEAFLSRPDAVPSLVYKLRLWLDA